MIDFGRLVRASLMCGAIIALAACTTTGPEVAAPTAPVDDVVTGPDGTYKVGNPYQIDGVWYYPSEDYAYIEEGIASWYGEDFHGKRTANGERYDMNALTAAHPTLPMPSIVNVINLDNGRSVKLRINDRGPFKSKRIIDVSRRAAQLLGFQEAGTTRVRLIIDAEESLLMKNQALRKSPQEMPQIAAAPRGSVSSAALAPIAGTTLAPQRPATTPSAQQLPPPASVAPPKQPAKAIPVGAPAGGTFVQAGAFGEEANAQRLSQQLREFGNVFVVPTFVNDRQLYRVRLGPLEDDATAEALLARVKSYGYPDALIVRY